MDNFLTLLPEEVVTHCITKYWRPRDRNRIWTCCKAIRSLKIIWSGLEEISVCSDDELAATIKVTSSYDSPDLVPLSAFKSALPFVKPSLTSLELRRQPKPSQLLDEIMQLLKLIPLPKLKFLRIFSGLTPYIDFSPLQEADLKNYGSIISNLPSFIDISVPSDPVIAESLLRLACFYVKPLPKRICMSYFLPDFLLENLPYAIEDLVDRCFPTFRKISFDPVPHLDRIWMMQNGLFIGRTPIKCMTLLHLLAANRHPEAGLVERVFAQVGEQAVNVARPSMESLNLTPFLCAVGTNRIDMVRMCLQKFNPSLSHRAFTEIHRKGFNALELACALQLPEIVELLLSLRADFASSLSDAEIFRLFGLAQSPNNCLRPTGFIHHTAYRPTADPQLDGPVRIVQSLERFFKSRLSLASFRDPQSERSLLHCVNDIKAFQYLISRGVDPDCVDAYGKSPFDQASEALLLFSLPEAFIMSLIKVTKAPLQPNTQHLRRLVQCFAELRYRTNRVVEQDPDLVSIEAHACSIASKEDLEAVYFRVPFSSMPPNEAHLFSTLWCHMGSGAPYLDAFRRNKCSLPPNAKYLIDEWIIRAANTKSATLLGNMNKMDCLLAGRYGIQSLFQDCKPANAKSPALPRVDVLHKVCFYLWNLSGQMTEEATLAHSIALEMIDGYFKLGIVYPLEIAARDMPGDEMSMLHEVKEVKYKLLERFTALYEDVDLVESFDLLFKSDHD